MKKKKAARRKTKKDAELKEDNIKKVILLIRFHLLKWLEKWWVFKKNMTRYKKITKSKKEETKKYWLVAS